MPTSASSEVATPFTERLRVPLRWWLLALLFVASLWAALLVSTPPRVAWTATGVLVVMTVGLLVGYGHIRVYAGPAGLDVGRAHLAWSACGGAVALDARATARVRGVDADARAYLVLRPYIAESVRVDLVDPADPTPYWLISSRRPHLLVAAVTTWQALHAPTVQD